MGIKFAVEKAQDGRYNYGTEAQRDKLRALPRGLFQTPEGAAEALTAAVQKAFDAGVPAPIDTSPPINRVAEAAACRW